MSDLRKKNLIEYLLANAKGKIEELTQQIEELKESRNSESKSTAGDKHAVGRAMAQTELDTLEKRIVELKEKANAIKNLPIEPKEEVGSGSLVETSQGMYFLAVGLGKIELDGKSYFIVSPAAPIGQAMLGKRNGDVFVFRELEILIMGIS
ncbi:MAG TPA: hypothetical protein VJ949_13685 [Cryomorphaceae bacterium]|nr:hypothetical protein [Cryomorphaceae bacterium]